jgi:hypothetical protein
MDDRWIACSERLPREEKDYGVSKMVLVDGDPLLGTMTLAWYSYRRNKWRRQERHRESVWNLNPTHWMSLPASVRELHRKTTTV